MKKRLLTVLLCLTMALALLAPSASAAETRLKSVDLVIELLKAGDIAYTEQDVVVKSIKSGSLDLLGSGIADVQYTIWDGDLGENENGDYVFLPGTTYLVTIKLSFDTAKGYCANYVTMDDGYVVTDETFSATVNGVKAAVRWSAPYYTTLQVSLTIPGDRLSGEEQTRFETQQRETMARIAAARRATPDLLTQAQADELQLSRKATNVVVMDGSDKGRGYTLGYLEGLENVGTLIMDVDDSAYLNYYVADEFTTTIKDSPFLKEVWLSPKVDVYKFIRRMDESLTRPMGNGPWYWVASNRPFYTAQATLFVPESALPVLKEALVDGIYHTVYTVKTYSGADVYAAQKRGASAAKEWCTQHVYTDQLMSADRACTYETCRQSRQWYYSCEYCGKCEYNPNHTFNRNYHSPDPVKPIGHGDLYDNVAKEEAYIGVNAAGLHVYWQSCQECGLSYRYLQTHLTQADAAGYGGTLEQMQEDTLNTLKMLETLALNSTETMAGMFVQLEKNTAKTSTWAQSDVNWALNDNLLDTDLLGSDYTKPITRLQFCSVAVRLAEELTGKSITPAPASTFTDTANLYVLKAYAAGITTGTSSTTFSPTGTLNRQQMAAFLYRALRYVERNSDYAYTSYTSKLASYQDNARVKNWAKEAMAFMNALDLIKGTSSTTLSPEGPCTIEQAVTVAERSVYAHQIGWAQVTEEGAGMSYSILPIRSGTPTNTNLNAGDIVWVTGPRLGGGITEDTAEFNLLTTLVPVKNPYTGQTQYLQACFLRPIRG